MSTTPRTVTDLFATIPATHDDPPLHIRLRRTGPSATLQAWRTDSHGNPHTTVTSTAPVLQWRRCLTLTPDGPILTGPALRAGVFTVPLTRAQFDTILSWA